MSMDADIHSLSFREVYHLLNKDFALLIVIFLGTFFLSLQQFQHCLRNSDLKIAFDHKSLSFTFNLFSSCLPPSNTPP